MRQLAGAHADAHARRRAQTLGGRAADALLTLVEPGDYVALLAYLGPDADARRAVSRIPPRRPRSHRRRDDVRLRTAVSALDRTAAQGRPEHRRVRAGHREPAPRICRFPGEPFSFGTLELAQALGDFAVARRDGPARAARAPAGTRRRRVEGRARRPAGGDSDALSRNRAGETGSGIAAAPGDCRRHARRRARSPATSTSGTWRPRGELDDGRVQWVEVCFCPTPLAEEREYWEEYFTLEKVQDAHARSRCRDLNGTEPWACCDCDCSRAPRSPARDERAARFVQRGRVVQVGRVGRVSPIRQVGQ